MEKAVSPTGKTEEGTWDSIHVFEAIDKGHTYHYKLTSTVILHMSTNGENVGEVDLSGNMTRQVEQDMAVRNDSWQIVNIGKVRLFFLLLERTCWRYIVCKRLTL